MKKALVEVPFRRLFEVLQALEVVIISPGESDRPYLAFSRGTGYWQTHSNGPSYPIARREWDEMVTSKELTTILKHLEIAPAAFTTECDKKQANPRPEERLAEASHDRQ